MKGDCHALNGASKYLRRQQWGESNLSKVDNSRACKTKAVQGLGSRFSLRVIGLRTRSIESACHVLYRRLSPKVCKLIVRKSDYLTVKL